MSGRVADPEGFRGPGLPPPAATAAEGAPADAFGAHVEGRRHGRWWIARPDGWAEEGCYVHGLLHGEWVLRDPEGRIVARERWCLGRPADPGPADGADAACTLALPDACGQEPPP